MGGNNEWDFPLRVSLEPLGAVKPCLVAATCVQASPEGFRSRRYDPGTRDTAGSVLPRRLTRSQATPGSLTTLHLHINIKTKEIKRDRVLSVKHSTRLSLCCTFILATKRVSGVTVHLLLLIKQNIQKKPGSHCKI